jgi:hypothetical protein
LFFLSIYLVENSTFPPLLYDCLGIFLDSSSPSNFSLGDSFYSSISVSIRDLLYSLLLPSVVVEIAEEA